MILKDICLLAADTSRSAYLTSLIKHKLIPALILLLPNNDIKNLPGNTKKSKEEIILINRIGQNLFDTTMNIENF